MNRFSIHVSVLALALALGCSSGGREDPILQLSAAEAIEVGKELMAEKKYRQARKYLVHAYEVEPNSASGREGLLLGADALYFEGNQAGYIEAESRYRDFINRFPTSPNASYAQFQIANSLTRRMTKPNRDQTIAHKALAAYQDLIRLYPTSEHAAQAREEMVAVTNNLAEHEFLVGSFYIRFGLARSAADRFNELLEKYPEYPERDKILFHLCRAYERSQQLDAASETCARLQEEYPESRYVDQLPALEEDPKDVEQAAADRATDGQL